MARSTEGLPAGINILQFYAILVLVDSADCVSLLLGVMLSDLVVGVTGSTDEPAALILLCISVHSGVRIARELFAGARRWLVLTFHTTCLVFLGVAPLMQLEPAGGSYPRALYSGSAAPGERADLLDGPRPTSGVWWG